MSDSSTAPPGTGSARPIGRPSMVGDSCPVCGRIRRVVVAVSHPAMRGLIIELLGREPGCWSVVAVSNPARLAAVVAQQAVDLIVVDGAGFPTRCRGGLDNFRLDHVVVIGAEPGDAYEAAALRHGAGAWLPRDRVGEDLVTALHDTVRRAAE